MDPQLDLNVKLTPQTTLKKTNKQFPKQLGNKRKTVKPKFGLLTIPQIFTSFS